MDVTPLIRSNQQVIQSYSNGIFKVSGKKYDTAIFVMPDETFVWDINIDHVDDLRKDDFTKLIDKSNEIDVVLLGSGANMDFMPKQLKQDLKQAGLSVDIMDTGAACRTYNVLMAEGRRVACALLPV
ncbi:MAG: hypothetical protein GC137_05290 [Alphaproteobacteria bacterium]|nr:hypothetical protein [Alphaproteobacteria bacterium]